MVHVCHGRFLGATHNFSVSFWSLLSYSDSTFRDSLTMCGSASACSCNCFKQVRDVQQCRWAAQQQQLSRSRAALQAE